MRCPSRRVDERIAEATSASILVSIVPHLHMGIRATRLMLFARLALVTLLQDVSDRLPRDLLVAADKDLRSADTSFEAVKSVALT